jgi:hypothetical protein
MSERIPTADLVEQARALLADDPIPHGPGWAAFERIAWSELLTALVDRLAEVAALAEAIRSERAAPHQGPPPPPHR